MDLKIRVMKIKGLLFGLFACAALAACTNDDIVENNGCLLYTSDAADE